MGTTHNNTACRRRNMETVTSSVLKKYPKLPSAPPSTSITTITNTNNLQNKEDEEKIQWYNNLKRQLLQQISNDSTSQTFLTKAWLTETELKLTIHNYETKDNALKHAEDIFKLYSFFIMAQRNIDEEVAEAVWNLYTFLRKFADIEKLPEILQFCVEHKHLAALEEYSAQLQACGDDRWVEYAPTVTPQLLDHFFVKNQPEKFKAAFQQFTTDHASTETPIWWYYHMLLTDLNQTCDSKCNDGSDNGKCLTTDEVLFTKLFGFGKDSQGSQDSQDSHLSLFAYPKQYLEAAKRLLCKKHLKTIEKRSCTINIEKIANNLQKYSKDNLPKYNYDKHCSLGFYYKYVRFDKDKAVTHFKDAININVTVEVCNELAELIGTDPLKSAAGISPKNFPQVGDQFDCLDTYHKWYVGTVLKVDGKRIFIHYETWTDKWDEWLWVNDTTRVAKLYTHTDPKTKRQREGCHV